MNCDAVMTRHQPNPGAWSWNDPSELSCITCHYTWAACGKEIWIWMKRQSSVKAKSWGGIQPRAWSSQCSQHSGEGACQAWRGDLDCVDQCPLQGSTLTHAELVRCCCCLRVWNGRQGNQKRGGNITTVFEAKSTNSCDPQSHVVPSLLCAWLFNGSLDIICFWYQENVKYFASNPQIIMNMTDYAAIKMIIM